VNLLEPCIIALSSFCKITNRLKTFVERISENLSEVELLSQWFAPYSASFVREDLQVVP